MNRLDLQALAHDRLADVQVLLVAERWAAAYYLAGYAVECALKACIAKLMKSEEFPDKKFAEKCWTHSLPTLLQLAGLKSDFEQTADRDLEDYWDRVKDWNEESRYVRTWSKVDAQQLYEAITDEKHGVLSWVKLRW